MPFGKGRWQECLDNPVVLISTLTKKCSMYSYPVMNNGERCIIVFVDDDGILFIIIKITINI